MGMGIVENVFGREVDHTMYWVRHTIWVRSAKTIKSLQAQWTSSTHYQGPPGLSIR